MPVARIYLGIDFQILFPYLALLVRQWIHALVSTRGFVGEFHTFFYVKVYPALEVDSVLLSSVMEKCLFRQPKHVLRRFSPFYLEMEKCAQSMLQVHSLPDMAPARDGSVHDGTATSGSIGLFAHICVCWITRNSLSVLWTVFLQQRRFGPLYLAVTCSVLFLAVRLKSTCFRILREMTSGLVSVFSAFSWYDSGWKFASVHGALWTDFTRFST